MWCRWIKFEEDVEEGGERWSKPHVATLSLHSLFELRKGIMSGTVMLDVDANNLSQLVGEFRLTYQSKMFIYLAIYSWSGYVANYQPHIS